MKGTVKQRGKTWTYYFKVPNGKDGNGKNNYRQITKGGFATKRECDAALRDALKLYDSRGFVQTNSNYTLSEYINYWYETVARNSLKHNTLDLYYRSIKNHINPEIGFVKLNNINPMALQKFFSEKQKNLSNSSINAMRNVLNNTFKLAVKQGLIVANPMKQIELKSKPKSKRIGYIQNDELEIILSDIKGTRYYIPFIIAIQTGARRGEVLALTWDDINFETKKIDFRKSLLAKDGEGVELSTTKTSSSNRTILMTNKLISDLLEWKTLQDQKKEYYGEHYYSEHNFICTNDDGTPINPKRFSTQVTRISNRLGIDFKFHDLRHTHATRLLLSDVNAKVIQERLGHSDIMTTLNVYSHVTPKLEADALAKFENMFN